MYISSYDLRHVSGWSFSPTGVAFASLSFSVCLLEVLNVNRQPNKIRWQLSRVGRKVCCGSAPSKWVIPSADNQELSVVGFHSPGKRQPLGMRT